MTEIVPMPKCEELIRQVEARKRKCRDKECWEKCDEFPMCPVDVIEEAK
jgi:hypothetical protein